MSCEHGFVRRLRSLAGDEWQFEEKARAGRCIGYDGQTAAELAHQPPDDPESQARARLIDVEAFWKADAVIGHFDVQASSHFTRRHVDSAVTAGIGMFDRIGDEFVDQKAEGKRMIGRQLYRVGMAAQGIRSCCAMQSAAEVGHENGKVDEADMCAARKTVMDLGDGRDT